MLFRRADLFNEALSKNAPWAWDMKPVAAPAIDPQAGRDENLSRLAYFKWEQAGKPGGMEALFWGQAEQEYLRQLKMSRPAKQTGGNGWWQTWSEVCRSWKLAASWPTAMLARANLL